MVKRDLIRNIILVFIAILVFFLLRIFVFSTFKVHQDASNSYLQTNDVVVVDQNRNPEKKDFIVYKEKGVYYISRIIGTEYENVKMVDDILYVNNSFYDEPYLDSEKMTYTTGNDSQLPFTSDFSVESITNGKYTKIPEGYYLVLNDNRQNNKDSRKFGLIAKNQIRGVINFKIYPLSKFGFLKNE